MKSATQKQIEAFENGRRCRELYRSEAAAYYDSLLDAIADMPIRYAFWRAGFYGHEMPTWATGWRYGNVPECGHSYNYAEQRPELGVSMFHVDGNDYPGSKSYEMFNGGQKKVRCAGWLIGFRGSDGEPLFVGAEEIK